MMEEEHKICAECNQPIKPGTEVYPYVNSEKPTHPWCAENAACSEVVDAYNAKGIIGLEQLDNQREVLQALNVPETD